MVRDPRHRERAVALAAEHAEASPPGLFEEALYNLVTTGACTNDNVTYAYDLFQNQEHRAAMDAFLLAKVALSQIEETLEVPQAVVEMYRYLFMDVDVFRNRLELQSYSASYDGSDYGRELVRTAALIGLEYLLWAFGKTDNNIDNRMVVRRTMLDAYMRGMAHKGNALTSATTKAAKDWWQTAIQNAQILEKLDPRTAKNAHDELRVAIEKRDDTLTVDNAPVPIDQILH